MSPRSLLFRRPPASLVVSFVALFVALGGAGYAALHVPPNSVGTAQLQNFSVGNAKLKPNSVGPAKIIAGAVGARQVNSTQVQLRVTGPCTAGAIQAIALSGNVTCTPVLPNEYGTSASPVTLGSGPTQIASEPLPSRSSYLVLAYPSVTVSGAAGHRVEVDCTLSVPPGTGTATTANRFAVDVTSPSDSLIGTIPLVLSVPSATTGQTATVSCSDAATPGSAAAMVSVGATLNAIQTAANN
jgi:hypothetical protein